ncbi:MAG TPA: hypothetical protein VKB23_11855 [Solirubrobacterales bacterium]|nr:hypothetical protein [Solirubrobacterales bacterium]
MSKTSSASRIVGEGAVPLRGSLPQEGEAPTKTIDETPVPLRLGAERVEQEEREARLRLLTGRTSRGRPG